MIINKYQNNDSVSVLGLYWKLKEKIKNKYPFFYERCILPISYTRQERKHRPQIIKDIEGMYLNGSTKLFTTVEIETINRCNETCTFCPVNRNSDTRPFQRMDEYLFNSIIEQLRILKYSGMLGLYSNNEPLLDKRIIDFCRIARRALPEAILYLYTNGALLTIDKLNQLMKFLDRLYIDNYNDDLKLIEPVREIYEYCIKNNVFKEKIRIFLRKKNELLSTRAGQAKNRSKIKPMKSPCILPFGQLVIRPSGKVSLCSYDALGHTTMGDLTKDSILEVWNNELYKKYREKILDDRKNIDICSKCDTLTTLESALCNLAS